MISSDPWVPTCGKALHGTLTVDRRGTRIAYTFHADTLDVIAAVNVAREYNLTIAVYGGGTWPVGCPCC